MVFPSFLCLFQCLWIQIKCSWKYLLPNIMDISNISQIWTLWYYSFVLLSFLMVLGSHLVILVLLSRCLSICPSPLAQSNLCLFTLFLYLVVCLKSGFQSKVVEEKTDWPTNKPKSISRSMLLMVLLVWLKARKNSSFKAPVHCSIC